MLRSPGLRLTIYLDTHMQNILVVALDLHLERAIPISANGCKIGADAGRLFS